MFTCNGGKLRAGTEALAKIVLVRTTTLDLSGQRSALTYALVVIGVNLSDWMAEAVN